MKKRVLGYGTRWREEKGVPSIRIGGIRPGGVVDILVSPADPAFFEMPESIVVVYTPANTVPENANVTPDSLLGSGGRSGKVAVPPGGGAVTCRVAGITPGDYDVQLIYEYADDGVPPTGAPAGTDAMNVVGQGTLVIPRSP